MSLLSMARPSTALLWTRDPLEVLEQIARRGFSGAEVWSQHLHLHGTRPQDVRRRADELGLTLCAHAVSYDLNPCSLNPDIRQVSWQQAQKSLLDAAIMRAEVVVVHPGHKSSSTDEYEVYWPALLEFCAEMQSTADLLDLTVGMEGMEDKIGQFFCEPVIINRLAAAMQAESWDRLGITADIAHLATFTDPVPAFKQIQRVVHVHISDGAPPKATHRPLGLGELPLDDMFAAIVESGAPRFAIEGRWRQDEEVALDRAIAYFQV